MRKREIVETSTYGPFWDINKRYGMYIVMNQVIWLCAGFHGAANVQFNTKPYSFSPYRWEKTPKVKRERHLTCGKDES
jgi:hypothetical protein